MEDRHAHRLARLAAHLIQDPATPRRSTPLAPKSTSACDTNFEPGRLLLNQVGWRSQETNSSPHVSSLGTRPKPTGGSSGTHKLLHYC